MASEKPRGFPTVQGSANMQDSHELLVSHVLLFLSHSTSPKAKRNAQCPRRGTNKEASFHPAAQDF